MNTPNDTGLELWQIKEVPYSDGIWADVRQVAALLLISVPKLKSYAYFQGVMIIDYANENLIDLKAFIDSKAWPSLYASAVSRNSQLSLF